MINNEFDVVIVGGGPSGSICGISLKKLNPQLRVCILEKEKSPRYKACGDGIGPGIVNIIKDLGLNSILNNREVIDKLAVTSPNGYQLLSDLPQIGNSKPVGYVIPRYEFDSYLLSCAKNIGVIVFEETEFLHFKDVGDFETNVVVKNTNEEFKITTKILVGADGARSKLRELLGIPFNSDKNTGIALRYYCEIENYNNKFLRLDFLKEINPGYGWIFPINNKLANIGVGVDLSKLKKKNINLNEMFESYRKYINIEFGVKIIDGTKKSSILPYGSQLPTLVNGLNKVLIGDAGSMINPFTGEGIFYGMIAANTLAKCISDKFCSNQVLSESLLSFESQFRNQFVKHYKINRSLKHLMGTRFSNVAIKASHKNQEILKEGIELAMGERRGFSLFKIIKIIFKGMI
jgi:geranylgeranyl reductase family protein